MPRKIRIDEVDLLLLVELLANSRIKNSDLARLTGLAESSIANRIAWLEDQGVLQGYTAILGTGQLGLLDQMVQFRIEADRPAHARDFENNLRGIDAVASIKRLVGPGRYMVRAIGQDFRETLSDAAQRSSVRLSGLGLEAIEHEVKVLRGLPLSILKQ